MGDTATIVQLPWLTVFDQDIPARILSAVSYGTGFVILGEPPGAPEEFQAVLSRLHEAGFVSILLTAPLARLSVLQDAIGGAMTATTGSGHPLVVVIRQAESLSYATVQRLIALAELRQDGRPVLRFLLTGTPGLWPVLHSAGLGHLKDDPAAHIRPNQTAAVPLQEPVPGVFTNTATSQPRTLAKPTPYAMGPSHGPQSLGYRLRESLSGHGTALARVAMVGIGLAGIGVAGWFILAPGSVGPEQQLATAMPAAVAVSPDARFAALIDKEKRESASHQLSSPPGDNLLETRRQIDELLPLVSSQLLHSLTEASTKVDTDQGGTDQGGADQGGRAADHPPLPAPLPVLQDVGRAPAMPAFDLLHVTLRYSRGDKAAEARAGRLLALLRSRGILVDGPEPAGSIIEQSSLAFYFDQDRAASLELVKQLSPEVTEIRNPMMLRGSFGGASMPRPGEIVISIGFRNGQGQTPVSSGKQT